MTQIATPAFAGATSSKFGGFVEHNTRTTSDLQDLADPRFHRQIEHLHRLGPRVFGELLAEIYAWQAEIINANWQKSIGSIIQTGRDLAAARSELSRSEFEKMIEADLPFSKSAADKLINIAAHHQIGSSGSNPSLPPSWAVLSELASLSAEDFENAQARGLTTKRATS